MKSISIFSILPPLEKGTLPCRRRINPTGITTRIGITPTGIRRVIWIKDIVMVLIGVL